MKRRQFIRRSAATLCAMETTRWGLPDVSGYEGGNDVWPCWNGPNRDNRAMVQGELVPWGPDGPQLVAQTDGLGEGFSNLCFADDRIYTLGDFDNTTYLVTLERATGKVVGKTEIAPGGPVGGYVGPKSTPAAQNGSVFALNQNGILFRYDIRENRVRWKKDLRKDYDGALMLMSKNMHWGFSESPLLEGNSRLICSPGGGKGTLAALDRDTGDVVWRSSALTDPCSYASVNPIFLDGVRQYLVMTDSHVAGILPENGELLWQFDFPSRLVLCTDPICRDGIVVATSANKNGTVAYRVQKKGDRFVVSPAWNLPEIDNTHHGLICIDGFVYSTSKNGYFHCVELATGRVRWRQRFRSAVSLGCVNRYLILREEKSGAVFLVEANPERYTEKGAFAPSERPAKMAWTYPVVVDGKLFLRDQNRLFQYRM